MKNSDRSSKDIFPRATFPELSFSEWYITRPAVSQDSNPLQVPLIHYLLPSPLTHSITFPSPPVTTHSLFIDLSGSSRHNSTFPISTVYISVHFISPHFTTHSTSYHAQPDPLIYPTSSSRPTTLCASESPHICTIPTSSPHPPLHGREAVHPSFVTFLFLSSQNPINACFHDILHLAFH